MPGTPWDMSSNGLSFVGRYAAAHLYACGMLHSRESMIEFSQSRCRYAYGGKAVR